MVGVPAVDSFWSLFGDFCFRWQLWPGCPGRQDSPQEFERLPMWGLAPSVEGTMEIPTELQIMTDSLLKAALNRGRIRALRDVYAQRILKPAQPERMLINLDT